MSRLDLSRLKHLPSGVQIPRYAPNELAIGVVHLGIGAFHRAHQAVYFDDLHQHTGHGLGILGVSLRGTDVRDQLEPQNGLYSVLSLNDAQQTLRIIGAVRGVLHAPSNPEHVLQAMADDNTKMWSLTITEKGYCHLPATGELDFNHPDIQADLTATSTPRSAIAYLVSALERRFVKRSAPIILCCDNLPDNGKVLRRLVMSFARARHAALAEWIEQEVAFPSTMVDRIVPATTAADIENASSILGCQDLGLVKAEPFSQWVIEQDTRIVMPRLNEVGALFVPSVAPFERIKLRLLNGAHSTLAYLGQLCGHEFVADTMANDVLRHLVTHLMDIEVTPTLEVPAGFDLAIYRNDLRARFANRALAHRTQQIAMDGSQKLPQRLLGSLRDQLARDGDIRVLSLAVAAWLRYLKGIDANGVSYQINDPLANELQALINTTGSIADQIDALLAYTPVFGEDLRHQTIFKKQLLEQLESFYQQGAERTCINLMQRLYS